MSRPAVYGTSPVRRRHRRTKAELGVLDEAMKRYYKVETTGERRILDRIAVDVTLGGYDDEDGGS